MTPAHPLFRQPAAPAVRELCVFAFDPSLAIQLETWEVNETVLRVPWEGGAADFCTLQDCVSPDLQNYLSREGKVIPVR